MEYITINDLQFPNLKCDNVLVLYMIDLEQQSLSTGLEALSNCIVNNRKAITDGNMVSSLNVGDTIKHNMVNTALVLNSRKEVVDVKDKILIRIEDIIYKAVSKQIVHRFKDVESVNMAIHICERLPNDTYYYQVYRPYTGDCLNENMSYYEICDALEFRSTSVSALILQLKVLQEYMFVTDFIRCIHGMDYQIYVDDIRILYNDGHLITYDEIEDFLKDFLSVEGGNYSGKKRGERKWEY